jgi:sugar lactone lactonase YvrE
LWRPNGCAIMPDPWRLIVAETRVHRLTQFDILADGQLANPREFATLADGSWADGICIDVAGGVWVADPRGQQCLRVEGGGVVTDIVDTSPLASVTCALGGPGGRRLFVAVSELADPHSVLPKRQARIDWLDVTHPGNGSP